MRFANVTRALFSAQAIKAVDKIHLEVNAGPSRRPTNAFQLLQSLRSPSTVLGSPCKVIISAPAVVFSGVSLIQILLFLRVFTGSFTTGTSVL